MIIMNAYTVLKWWDDEVTDLVTTLDQADAEEMCLTMAEEFLYEDYLVDWNLGGSFRDWKAWGMTLLDAPIYLTDGKFFMNTTEV